MNSRSPLRPLPRALLFAIAIGVAGCSGSDDDSGGDVVTDGDTPGGEMVGDVPGDEMADDMPDEGMTEDAPDGGMTEDDTGDGTGGMGDDTAGGLVNAVGLEDVAGDVGQIGHVSIEQRGAGRVIGRFVRFSADFPALSAIEGFQPPLDTCEVTGSPPLPILFGDFEGIDRRNGFETVSAGEQLVFTSPSGTFLSLPREQISGSPVYVVLVDGRVPLDEESSPSMPIPSELSLDVPGDDFPAFADVAVPDPAPLTGVVPDASATVDADTVFRWDAGDDPNAYIAISATASEPGGRLSNTTTVACFVRDDGEFAFPSETRAELGGFNTSGAAITRTALTILSRGDVLLVVSNASR